MKKFLYVLLISLFFTGLNILPVQAAERSVGRPVSGPIGSHGGAHIHHAGPPHHGAMLHRPPMGPPPPPSRHYYRRAVNPVYVRVRYAYPCCCEPYYDDYYDPYYCPCQRRSARCRIPNSRYSVIYYE